MPSIPCIRNLLIIVIENPVIIEAIAPASVNRVQNKDKIIIGQKVAAIPDQPKITNQKITLSGDTTETTIESPNANAAITTVMILHNFAAFISERFPMSLQPI